MSEGSPWKTYSKKLRLAAIRDILSGHLSLVAATKKHHISSTSVLSKWISKYTQEIELKPTRKGKAMEIHVVENKMNRNFDAQLPM